MYHYALGGYDNQALDAGEVNYSDVRVGHQNQMTEEFEYPVTYSTMRNASITDDLRSQYQVNYSTMTGPIRTFNSNETNDAVNYSNMQASNMPIFNSDDANNITINHTVMQRPYQTNYSAIQPTNTVTSDQINYSTMQPSNISAFNPDDNKAFKVIGRSTSSSSGDDGNHSTVNYSTMRYGLYQPTTEDNAPPNNVAQNTLPLEPTYTSYDANNNVNTTLPSNVNFGVSKSDNCNSPYVSFPDSLLHVNGTNIPGNVIQQHSALRDASNTCAPKDTRFTSHYDNKQPPYYTFQNGQLVAHQPTSPTITEPVCDMNKKSAVDTAIPGLCVFDRSCNDASSVRQRTHSCGGDMANNRYNKHQRDMHLNDLFRNRVSSYSEGFDLRDRPPHIQTSVNCPFTASQGHQINTQNFHNQSHRCQPNSSHITNIAGNFHIDLDNQSSSNLQSPTMSTSSIFPTISPTYNDVFDWQMSEEPTKYMSAPPTPVDSGIMCDWTSNVRGEGTYVILIILKQ